MGFLNNLAESLDTLADKCSKSICQREMNERGANSYMFENRQKKRYADNAYLMEQMIKKTDNEEFKGRLDSRLRSGIYQYEDLMNQYGLTLEDFGFNSNDF